ncbi:MAG: mannitol dehydrogenase family protein, partial [Pseudomonadota bacterium]|nr:mannitol dehydrogenase family protein [Pseudomonadota bacterium]
MSTLGNAALGDLPRQVGRPTYDRSRLATGILHFGPGAFHRAHQADYIDRLLADDPRWAIAAVSLRSPGTVDALKRQDGLYTLAIIDAAPAFRVLGAHTRFYGPGEAAKVRAELASPDLKVVTSTVTEKGYCLEGDGTLDFDHPDILHDLETWQEPESLIGWLTLGLRDRRSAGLAPFTPLCCDNMVSNGRKLGAAVEAFARRLDPALADWIAGEVRFPNSMVDSITPATDEPTRRQVREALGVLDAIPVRREAYAAWIIEDVLPTGAPDLQSVGAVLTSDVAAYELAKLRILNGAHSSLAYLGLLMGHDTVADAMRDGELACFVERLILDDIIPSLTPSFDLQHYAGEIIERFRNPSIGHKLSQIAWDGSQKLPYRLLDTVADALRAGRPVERLAIPVAAWMLFVERQARADIEIVDPLGDRLAEIGRGSDLVGGLLGIQQIFPNRLALDPAFRPAVDKA